MGKSKLGLVGNAKAQLVKRFLVRRDGASAADGPAIAPAMADVADIPDRFCRFDELPAYKTIALHRLGADKLGVVNPFFKSHDGLANATTQIGGRSYINFSSYNYLDLSGDDRVNRAAIKAIEHYGTSPSASRLVAGERPVQRELEQALAEHYGVDDCAVFVSGHATNVSTISTLFGPKDLVIHDSLIHNSILEGIKLSGASRRAFAHNDPAALESLLAELRGNFERTLIVVEGHYSMDGDIPDLPRLIDIKKRYKAFLMVDEAHALGVLGAGGKGVHEHHGIAGREVDIWMGTLSKTLASCGGYIAGEGALIEMLKYFAPGFVYSVGIAPALAAAALTALRLVQDEPDRCRVLREQSAHFQQRARQKGIDTGYSQGLAIVPAIVGSSLEATRLSQVMFENGINVQPIIHPAVEEKAARLRFFMNCRHTTAQIDRALDVLGKAV